jgi:sugar phosphate isomerase/epimerase
MFLKLTGVAALGCWGLNRCDAAKPEARPRRRIAAHPWVYAASQSGYDLTPVLPTVFADLGDAGFEAVELMHTALRPDDAVERIAALSKQHALPVLGMSFEGAMWDRAKHAEIRADAEQVIPRLSRLGGRTLGISVGPVQWGQKIRKTPLQLDSQADLLRWLFGLCERHRITPNLHNHTYEVENDMHDLRGTLARIPEARLGPDLNWLVRAGVDPVAFLHEFGPRIIFLHLRDQGRDGRWTESLGEGATDWPAIASALSDIRFQGDVVVELAYEQDFKPTRPLRESLRLSCQFAKRIFAPPSSPN